MTIMERKTRAVMMSSLTPAKEVLPTAREVIQQSDVKQYISGVKLVLILTSTTLVYFLMMLDMSILATVKTSVLCAPCLQLTESKGNPIHHQRIPVTA